MKFNMNISDSPWPPCSAIFVKRQSPYLKEFTITFIPGKDTEIDYAQSSTVGSTKYSSSNGYFYIATIITILKSIICPNLEGSFYTIIKSICVTLHSKFLMTPICLKSKFNRLNQNVTSNPSVIGWTVFWPGKLSFECGLICKQSSQMIKVKWDH